MKEELKEYSFGEVLGKTFNLYFNNFIQITLVSILAYLPLVIAMVVFAIVFHMSGMLDNEGPERGFHAFIGLLTFLILAVVCSAYMSIYIVQLTSKRYLDEPINIRQLALSSFRFIFPVIILTIIQYIIIIFGYFLLFVPGIIFFIAYFITTQTLVIEKAGIFGSLKRSWQLTKGSRWEIFGLYFVVSLIMNTIVYIIMIFMIIIVFVIFQENPLAIFIIVFVLAYMLTALIMPLWFCMQVVIYYNQRVKNEAFNIEYLTRQFN